ncbi:MAG: LamG domain-containing protein, partial [Ignavibacteriae bacterium]
LDSTQSHPSGIWHHAAIVYGDRMMRQYVDGSLQCSGTVMYLPIDRDPKISIGVRQDLRYWFKGAISSIKVTKRALLSSEFTLPK